jgi:hypothetical protein
MSNRSVIVPLSSKQMQANSNIQTTPPPPKHILCHIRIGSGSQVCVRLSPSLLRHLETLSARIVSAVLSNTYTDDGRSMNALHSYIYENSQHLYAHTQLKQQLYVCATGNNCISATATTEAGG